MLSIVRKGSGNPSMQLAFEVGFSPIGVGFIVDQDKYHRNTVKR